MPGCLCCADASKQPAEQAEADNARRLASSDAFTAADESQEQGMHQRPTQPFDAEPRALGGQADDREPLVEDTNIAEGQTELGSVQHVQREALQAEQESLQSSHEVLSEVREAMPHEQQQQQHSSGTSQEQNQDQDGDSSSSKAQTDPAGSAPIQKGYGSEGQPAGTGEGRQQESSDGQLPTSDQPQQQHQSLTGSSHSLCCTSHCAPW